MRLSTFYFNAFIRKLYLLVTLQILKQITILYIEVHLHLHLRRIWDFYSHDIPYARCLE